MKTRSIFFSVLFAATAFTFLANCSDNKKEQATESQNTLEDRDEVKVSEPQFQVDEKFQQQLASVFSSYVELKEALVDSDVTKVQAEASETEEALTQVDIKLLSGAAHNDWMIYLGPIQNSLNEIQSADQIETQRRSFGTLSKNLYKSGKAFGFGGKEAFYKYCPMAFNNEGAYWLSDQEKIRNPYFGDKMLTCGEVKEKLK